MGVLNVSFRSKLDPHIWRVMFNAHFGGPHSASIQSHSRQTHGQSASARQKLWRPVPTGLLEHMYDDDDDSQFIQSE
jgi:hypothetical protein